jgi:hypothetical protein
LDEYYIFIESHLLSISIQNASTIKVLLPTDAQLNRLKNNFKIDTEIEIKTAPTCFGVITIIRERTI